MGTKLLAFLCTVDNQGTYTSALCLYPKSKEPVCFRLVSLSRACTQGRALGVLLYQGPFYRGGGGGWGVGLLVVVVCAYSSAAPCPSSDPPTPCPSSGGRWGGHRGNDFFLLQSSLPP